MADLLAEALSASTRRSHWFEPRIVHSSFEVGQTGGRGGRAAQPRPDRSVCAASAAPLRIGRGWSR
jgi:hypothetical protein